MKINAKIELQEIIKNESSKGNDLLAITIKTTKRGLELLELHKNHTSKELEYLLEELDVDYISKFNHHRSFMLDGSYLWFANNVVYKRLNEDGLEFWDEIQIPQIPQHLDR